MLKKPITYTDFDGNTRTEDHYFNLTRAELTKMQWEIDGGMIQFLDRIVKEDDSKNIMKYFDKFICMSYGEKSLDGKRFDKSPEITAKFVNSAAYDALFMELCSSTKACVDFFNAVIPQAAAGQDTPNLVAPNA